MVRVRTPRSATAAVQGLSPRPDAEAPSSPAGLPRRRERGPPSRGCTAAQPSPSNVTRLRGDDEYNVRPARRRQSRQVGRRAATGLGEAPVALGARAADEHGAAAVADGPEDVGITGHAVAEERPEGRQRGGGHGVTGARFRAHVGVGRERGGRLRARLSCTYAPSPVGLTERRRLRELSGSPTTSRISTHATPSA